MFQSQKPGQNSFPVLTQRDRELTLTGPSTFIVILKCINGFFSVEFNIPTDTPGDGSVPAVQGHSKKRIFGRIVKYIMDHPRSTLKDVAQYLKEEYKLEVSVKTIERELEEYDLSDL